MMDLGHVAPVDGRYTRLCCSGRVGEGRGRDPARAAWAGGRAFRSTGGGAWGRKCGLLLGGLGASRPPRCGACGRRGEGGGSGAPGPGGGVCVGMVGLQGALETHSVAGGVS
jgi:hypothetical protein